MKLSLIALCLFGSQCLLAQIPNSDFEDSDSLGIRGWDVAEGSAKVSGSTTFVAKLGDTTVKAVSKSRFLVLSNADETSGEISTTFPHTERSATLSGYFIFIHSDFRQRFSVEVVMTKWNGSSTDTIMHQLTGATTDDVDGNAFYDWVKLTVDLEASNYRMNGNPDSCSVVIRSDDGTKTVKNTMLLVDKLAFGSSVIASRIETGLPIVSVYPNPARDFITMSGLSGQPVDVEIIALSGQTILKRNGLMGEQQIDISSLQPGHYQIRISSQKSSVNKAFIKSF